MCRDAGCFTYSANHDILFINRSLLALPIVDCIQPITLPRPRKIANLFTGQTIAENATAPRRSYRAATEPRICIASNNVSITSPRRCGYRHYHPPTHDE